MACFHLALTHPVASVTAERSFSVIPRIKTHLRASMSEGRLSSLALIEVGSELSQELIKDLSAVIRRFCDHEYRWYE